MTRFSKFKPGEIDHIKIVSGSTKNDQVYECSKCGAQFDMARSRRRRRFALTHWKVEHAKCAIPPEVKYERLVERYHPDKITPAIASSMLKLEAELGIETLVPDEFRKPRET